jgi:hydroxymethylbilane synthase
MNERLSIGTRGSALAVAQTQWVIRKLHCVYPDLAVDIKQIITRGDATQSQNIPLSSFEQKGIFATEIENALLNGEIDCAVHSMKDLAHTLPEGLCIAAVPARESAADALIGGALNDLPAGARVGTGSVRRRALLKSRRPDLNLMEIRGNIDTRLRKLDDGQYDAICLAAAGLSRLGLSGRIAETLDTKWFVPDPGQGALAIECRLDDARARKILSALNDPYTFIATAAERAFLKEVGGGCHVPIGAYGIVAPSPFQGGRKLRLTAMTTKNGGLNIENLEGIADDPEELGIRAARRQTL